MKWVPLAVFTIILLALLTACAGDAQENRQGEPAGTIEIGDDTAAREYRVPLSNGRIVNCLLIYGFREAPALSCDWEHRMQD